MVIYNDIDHNLLMELIMNIPYGSTSINLALSDDYTVDIIQPMNKNPSSDQLAVIKSALENPVSPISWDKFRPNDIVSIAINDKTRPVPHHYLLPPLLEKMHSLQIPKNNVRLFIASGTHVPMEPTEYPQILSPEIINQYQIIAHDCDDQEDLQYLGETTRATPVLVNKRYLEADHRVVIGDIEPHHFMGYSGGVKSAAVGLAGRKTIDKNHSLLMDERSTLGNYENNPIRQDVEEIGKMIGVEVALNAILDSNKSILYAFAGNPVSVMQAGIPFSRSSCQIKMVKKYDLVIASAGGFPKDINFYQSQKALTHACLIANDYADVLLIAECREGIGSQGLEDFLKEIDSPQQVFDMMKSMEFKVGPHKAFLLAKQLVQYHISLFSSLEIEKINSLMINPVNDVQQYIDSLISQNSALRSIAIMPYATGTIACYE